MYKIELMCGGHVEFDEESLINFYNEDGEPTNRLDSSDLTILYGAYNQMRKERFETQGY